MNNNIETLQAANDRATCSQTFMVESKPIINTYLCNKGKLSALGFWKLQRGKKRPSITLHDFHVN